LLSRRIAGLGYGHVYALRRNIAYNLQYIEYLEQTLSDIKLTTVLATQTWKTEIVVGCGIVESLLHYLIVISGNQSTVDWEVTHEFTGAHKKIEEKIVRVDSVIRKRLDAPKPVPMTFDAMLKKAESKRLLGNDQAIYGKLNRLRPLRNRVHLQEIAQPVDHDFNAFTYEDKRLMMQVLYTILTGPLFTPSATQLAYFTYLDKYMLEVD